MRQLLAFSKVTVLCLCHDKEKKKNASFSQESIEHTHTHSLSQRWTTNEKLNQISTSERARARDTSIPIVTNSILLSFIIDFDCSINLKCGVHCVHRIALRCINSLRHEWRTCVRDRFYNKFYSEKSIENKKKHRRFKLLFIIIRFFSSIWISLACTN